MSCGSLRDRTAQRRLHPFFEVVHDIPEAALCVADIYLEAKESAGKAEIAKNRRVYGKQPLWISGTWPLLLPRACNSLVS